MSLDNSSKKSENSEKSNHQAQNFNEQTSNEDKSDEERAFHAESQEKFKDLASPEKKSIKEETLQKTKKKACLINGFLSFEKLNIKIKFKGFHL